MLSMINKKVFWMKNKFLITGFSGFVSDYFLDFLENNKIQSIVLGIDICKNIINL